jgi:hypothetical protein
VARHGNDPRKGWDRASNVKLGGFLKESRRRKRIPLPCQDRLPSGDCAFEDTRTAPRFTAASTTRMSRK